MSTVSWDSSELIDRKRQILSGLGVVDRKVRSQGYVQFPWKLIDRSLDFALLTSALLDHQLDVLVVQDTDEVALRIAVVQGDVLHLEDVSEGGQGHGDVRLQTSDCFQVV